MLSQMFVWQALNGKHFCASSSAASQVLEVETDELVKLAVLRLDADEWDVAVVAGTDVEVVAGIVVIDVVDIDNEDERVDNHGEERQRLAGMSRRVSVRVMLKPAVACIMFCV